MLIIIFAVTLHIFSQTIRLCNVTTQQIHNLPSPVEQHLRTLDHCRIVIILYISLNFNSRKEILLVISWSGLQSCHKNQDL